MSNTEANVQILNTIVTEQLEDARSPLGEFELPCGYLDPNGVLHTHVRVREITGAEEDILASKTIPSHRKMNLILERCTEAIGTISGRKDVSEAILSLPAGDRLFLLFAIRRVTLGDEYPFIATCPNEDCKAEKVYRVSLAELPVKKMPDPMVRVFDVVMPSKKTARFHVMTGAEEEKVVEASKDKSMKEAAKEARISLAMAGRIDLINGKAATLADVRSLGMRDRQFLREKFEEVEGGIDTSLDMVCSECDAEFDHEVAVDRGFFTPSSVKKGSKARSST